ncbi:MAG: hypothetical protein ABI567_02985 [Gammaproteobacteria bacterium]
MPRECLGGNAATRHEVARPRSLRHHGLELVGRVAIAIGDDDLVAREQVLPAAIPQLQPTVKTEGIHPGENQVSRPGR